METILECAIREETTNLIYKVPSPGRHHDVIRVMIELGCSIPIMGEQGFITSTERFVDRQEAGQIALDSKQIPRLSFPPRLHSEDLW